MDFGLERFSIWGFWVCGILGLGVFRGWGLERCGVSLTPTVNRTYCRFQLYLGLKLSQRKMRDLKEPTSSALLVMILWSYPQNPIPIKINARTIMVIMVPTAEIQTRIMRPSC